MYRLLALDLDGTLLRDDHTVDARDVAAIEEVRAAGVTVTIATGRLWTGAVAAAQACGIQGAIACMEGSHLVEVASGITLAHHPLERDLAVALRETVVAHNLAVFVFDAGGIHHGHAAASYAGYVRTWSPDLRVLDDGGAWPDAPLAAVAIGEPEAVAAAHAALRAHGERLFSVTFAVSHFPDKHALLVRSAGPSKGTALAELCRLSGCELADAVAVGDWYNDVPMFEVAGRSFAMGSAPDAVRASATDHLSTRAGAGGGIAEAIRRAWG